MTTATTATNTATHTATDANHATPALAVRGLTVAYGRTLALEDVSVTFATGAVTGIIGPNGAGKTTLLHTAMGMLPRAAGEIAFFGGPLASARRRVAFVPQREAVDWHFPVTVADVVAMGRYVATPLGRRLGPDARTVVADALTHVGMSEYAGRQIGTLSGGQQQRVFLARALAQGADLFILDEPFTGIDAASQETIYALLAELRDAGKSVILSTHDLMSIRAHCDDLLCLNHRAIAFGPAATTFRLDVLERTYGGRLLHLHDDAGVLLP